MEKIKLTKSNFKRKMISICDICKQSENAATNMSDQLDTEQQCKIEL